MQFTHGWAPDFEESSDSDENLGISRGYIIIHLRFCEYLEKLDRFGSRGAYLKGKPSRIPVQEHIFPSLITASPVVSCDVIRETSPSSLFIASFTCTSCGIYLQHSFILSIIVDYNRL